MGTASKLIRRQFEIGAPDRNRTCNPWIRSPILYPIELRAHTIPLFIKFFNDVPIGSSPLYRSLRRPVNFEEIKNFSLEYSLSRALNNTFLLMFF